MLAAHAAVAIENARLYEEVTSMNEQLEARVQQRTAQLEAVSAERAQYAARLRQVLNRTVRIQEAERQRIAKGVHDGVSQWLMGALFELQAARVRLPEELVDVEKHLSEAQRVLKDVKQEMRRVIYDLHPPLLESNGLVAALRGHITELQAHFPFHCRIEVTGEPIRLSPQQELAMYRIAQEALTNVMKHAGTDRATVGLNFESDVVRLWIMDEGRGFDQNNGRGTNKPSLGLLSMRERAMAVGGAFSMQTTPGQGTLVEVSVPIQSAGEPLNKPMVATREEISQ
jgi:signal transduction histidine kinase